MRCPKCETETTNGARFCSNCGAQFPITCPICGTTTEAEATFCPQCGARLSAHSTVKIKRTPAIAPVAHRSKQTAGYERRLVTILFADIVGFSSLSEFIDPEELLEIMHEAYPCLLEPVQHHDGTVVQVLGDGVLAYFGTPQAREDDPEHAIRAGLEIVVRIAEYAGRLYQERNLPNFSVRVGINTGLVVVGELSTERHLEYKALGDAVNLAARLQQNAPPGAVLVSHATYRHVRGLFEVQPQAPLAVKGRKQIEQTYLVQRIIPSRLYIRKRGVEGIETSMVGREPEMAALQNIYQDAIQGGEARLVVISGEAGLGKTRLLDEFVTWASLQSTTINLLPGRASANTRSAPFGVFRDLFAQNFEILESDSSTQALEKFRRGAQNYLEIEQADLVGQLAGFDFSTSPAVKRLIGSPSFAELAGLYLVSYFRKLANRPLLVLLEDLHWADDSSLDSIIDLITNLGRESNTPVMIVCTARSQLFERRPKWGEGILDFTRLELRPLSRLRSRSLISEILRKADNIPEALYELLVDAAEGSPFFIEELIKMLIEEGVIQTEPEVWRVINERLAGVHVPPTLAGILQARIDSLPPAERLALQRAAVVGRVFLGRSGPFIDRRNGRSTASKRPPGGSAPARVGFSPRTLQHFRKPGIHVQTCLAARRRLRYRLVEAALPIS